MIRYIAFLRAINVGSHNVKMEKLRTLFSDLGLSNVRSYINSGNIFFDSKETDKDKLASKIEKHLHESLGYEVPVFLRTTDEVEALLLKDPFKNVELTDDKRFSIIFTKEPLANSLSLPLASSKNDMDLVAVSDHEAFVVWHIINGRPPSGKFNNEVLPPLNTARFYHTLVKILAAAKAS